mmetsp:Transcript_7537/g.13312  ORF Transcript_7537/g.13312 Transcript_7537/m.13312 type:complete len:206 (+) Transcript_7537:436-1053(+)
MAVEMDDLLRAHALVQVLLRAAAVHIAVPQELDHAQLSIPPTREGVEQLRHEDVQYGEVVLVPKGPRLSKGQLHPRMHHDPHLGYLPHDVAVAPAVPTQVVKVVQLHPAVEGDGVVAEDLVHLAVGGLHLPDQAIQLLFRVLPQEGPQLGQVARHDQVGVQDDGARPVRGEHAVQEQLEDVEGAHLSGTSQLLHEDSVGCKCLNL